MPRLPTYTAEVQGVGGIESRRAQASSLSATAGAAGDLARSVSKDAEAILASMEEREQRETLVKNMENRATYAKRLQDAVTTGEPLDKIREEFETSQSRLYDNLQTRRGREAADYYSTQSGMMFEEKANSVEVQRAVDEARLQGQKFLDSAAATVGGNPAALPIIEQNIEAFVRTLPKLSPQQRATISNSLRQNINASAAMASARAEPEKTINAIKGGAFHLTPEQREQVLNEAERAISAKRTQESYERALKEIEKRDQDEGAREKHIQAIFKGTFNAQTALTDPALRPTTLEHLMVFADSWGKVKDKPTPSNPKVVDALWQAIHNPDAEARLYSADAVFRYVESQQLNHTDAGKLMSDIANQRDANNVKLSTKLRAQVNIIDQQLARDLRYKMRPELMAAIKMNYVARVEERMNDLRKDNKNPAQVFDRDNKLYAGTPEFVQGAINEARTGPNGALQKFTEPVQFPDGKWRVYKGSGNPEDVVNNWSVVDPLTWKQLPSPTDPIPIPSK